MTDERLERRLAAAPFVQEYGFQLEAAESGTCTVHWTLNEKFLRLDGIVSGPVLMAAADAAMWAAIITKLGWEAASTVTVEMKTNFLSAAKREEFWCTAKVMKVGSRLIFGTAECTAGDGRLLAHHTLTYIRRD